MKMVEKGFPKCPICEEEVLVPLSAGYGECISKTYAHWTCLKCGFYFGTGGTAGYNVPKDVNIGIIPEIPSVVKELAKSPTQRKFFNPK